MCQQRDELLAAPPFAVYGLAAPALRPYALSDYRRDDAGWHFLTLGYGDRVALAGPFLSVTTASPRDHVRRRHADEALLDAFLAERSRGVKDSGVESPAAAGQPRLADGRLTVDGEPAQARFCADDDTWVARVTLLSRLDVTVAGRGVRRADVRLVLVEDLAPYWHGRQKMFGRPFGT